MIKHAAGSGNVGPQVPKRGRTFHSNFLPHLSRMVAFFPSHRFYHFATQSLFTLKQFLFVRFFIFSGSKIAIRNRRGE